MSAKQRKRKWNWAVGWPKEVESWRNNKASLRAANCLSAPFFTFERLERELDHKLSALLLSGGTVGANTTMQTQLRKKGQGSQLDRFGARAHQTVVLRLFVRMPAVRFLAAANLPGWGKLDFTKSPLNVTRVNAAGLLMELSERLRERERAAPCQSVTTCWIRRELCSHSRRKRCLPPKEREVSAGLSSGGAIKLQLKWCS